MDWKEATSDDKFLDLVREEREKGEQESESRGHRRWNIKESMF